MIDEADAVKAVVQGSVEGALVPFTGLVERLFGGAVDEGGLIFRDVVRGLGLGIRMRMGEREVRFLAQTQRMLCEMGVEPQRVPLKLLKPIFENAVLEEDDALQDRWAALLANNAAGKYTESAFPEILKQLSSADAYLLKMCFYEVVTEQMYRFPPPTCSVRESIRKWKEAVIKNYPEKGSYPLVGPREPVSSTTPPVSENSVGNLIRLGLMSSENPEDDTHPLAPGILGRKQEYIEVGKCEVGLTAIGITFAYACEDPSEIQEAFSRGEQRLLAYG